MIQMKFQNILLPIALTLLLVQCTRFDTDSGYAGGEVIDDSLLTATYPELYYGIFARDEQRLRPYLDHQLLEVRKQAWRALTHTPIDTLDPYIEKARNEGLEVAWFALSLHPFNQELLRRLEVYWDQNPDKRGGISVILGRQGDEKSLDFLLARLEEAAGRSYEFQYALAIGRLMLEYEVRTEDQLQLLETAFSSDHSMVTRAYLYGYYRGDEQALPAEIKDDMHELWKSYGLGTSSIIDQYMVRILKERVFNGLVRFYSEEGLLTPNVQLGIELAQVAGQIELEPETVGSIERLLVHRNPHVVQQTLLSLEGRLEAGSELLQRIEGDLINGSDTSPPVWLQAVKTYVGSGSGLNPENRARLDRTLRDQPYLGPLALEIYRETDPAERYLQRIAGIVDEGDALRSMYAFQALEAFWTGLEQPSRTRSRVEKVRELVFEGLTMGDRGVAYTLSGLLADEALFRESDFEHINSSLKPFALPEDIEVYQEFGRLYYERFREEAQPVIDSLAAIGYAPLNRTLAEQGWEVDIPDESETAFRMPDWSRLWSLGNEPTWILQTEKGTIKIRMHPLSAPATVSAIDSLTRTGAYEGVPFHRVVPNFVIQGGDLERADGFGGPDFIIPTEARETGFYRGAVGIASAGPDTEGSQYFIMHQWKPHLNGRYTLFGTVTEGMKVVDRIVVGDRVELAYWE